MFTAVPSSLSCPAAALPVLGAEVPVPLEGGGEIGYAALDYAASAPALSAVWDEVAAYVPYYGSAHRGAGYLSRLSTRVLERSRAAVAGFLGCRPDDELVFTRSTTDSLNLLAAALPAGTRVFVFGSEHHAALLPWRGRELCCLPVPRTPGAAVRTLAEALRAAPEGPKLLCVTGASNVTGELWPVAELAAVAGTYGARVVLDAAQLAPHRPVDVAALGVDWVACSGHKLYAPFGAGVLAGRGDWLRRAEPYLAGGGASAAVSRDEGGGLSVEWRPDASRHEAGSPNVVGALAMAAACRTLAGAGWGRLLDHETALLRRLRTGLAELPGVREMSLFGPDAPRVAVVALRVDGWESGALAEVLSERYGIGVRAGLFCAHPLLRELTGAGVSGGCGSGAAAGAVRVSFGAGTPGEHIDRLLAALAELTSR